ncbi:penicillin-binding protein 2 [Hazenella sp. IB182357]|uniref:Penicillin-binding protein 2 n=1 Tax=Polycladospora coralii TaxID=2771432 RepID=A0A926N7A3_9BACL|nr:penicillin-binding protein 2 [Polycladospora coralii]MBD1371316.1 penicillin-binding protein 2 [Polycladospora coralii]MBS7530284.1 penicillin-binding protein 2 [Polycladospora coralii]
MSGRVRKSKMRSLVVGSIWTLCLSILTLRLFWIQTVESNSLTTMAMNNWMENETIYPTRGTIYDRTGDHSMAWDVNAYYIVANKKKMKDISQVARLLAPLLELEPTDLEEQLSKEKDDIQLRGNGKDRFPEEAIKKIYQLKEKGQLEEIYAFPYKPLRQYNGTEAAHVLGFVNQEMKPVEGVEKSYHSFLQGEMGRKKYLKSKNGIMMSKDPDEYQPAKNGNDLYLTIDARIQKQVEIELAEAVKNYDAKGGTAIVADPRNGEILAMANLPVYNPNQIGTYNPQENRTNQAIENQFEPGSTFKIVTLAAAIEEGVFNASDTFESGAIQVEDRTIRDWNDRGWGTITYREGVQKSSNVAFVKLGQKLGATKLNEYIKRFGFGDITKRQGKPTGIDLPAEGKGYYFNGPLYPSELATTSFGQGISVTPVQQISAISAIANGGTWYTPHVMKEIHKANSDEIVKTYPVQGKRIVSEDTAKQVRQLLRDVVEGGTGSEADVVGYPVGGKTGTAQKPKKQGGYEEDKYIVSFIGLAPYDNPDVVVYVAIDEPASINGSSSGGKIAAPVASQIIRKTLQIRQIQPNKELK